MAEVGLVKEDSERRTGRERWWRSAHRGYSWVETEHQDDPETRAAADRLVRYVNRQHNRRMDDYRTFGDDDEEAERVMVVLLVPLGGG